MCHIPDSSFIEVETTIGDALDELTQFCRFNRLRANHDKTQVTAFHLRNKEANRSLKVEWNRTELENTLHPNYLCVTLDRTLSYKEHIHNTQMKVATRNNLLRKLSNSKWGANASTIRTTALELCSASLGEIISRTETEPRAKQCMQSRHRMPEVFIFRSPLLKVIFLSV